MDTMEVLSEYTSSVVGFKAVNQKEKTLKLIDSYTSTDPLPVGIDAVVETNTQCSKESQTEISQALTKNVDMKKLANWLQKIYASVEKELLKGCTPVLESCLNELKASEINIQPYQKISIPTTTNSQGVAIWLSIYTSNAPALIVAIRGSHDNWCEHIEQYLKLFVPERVRNGNFITFKEEKCIPLKSCLKSICTNQFNKNIFAGSTCDGDILVWEYEQLYNTQTNSRYTEIKEIFHATPQRGCALGLAWGNEFTLLTAHSSGYVLKWNLGKEITMETEFFLKIPDLNTFPEICTLLALNMNDFVVGTKDGSIFHCMSSFVAAEKLHLEIVPLKKHLFMISTLLKRNINGRTILISCDLSGEVYFHYLRNSNDDNDTTVTQIPLSFTNSIACSEDGNLIYSPGDDGCLNCYRPSNGSKITVKGELKGKGHFIASSDNGCWLITGLYGNNFQIFSVAE